MWTRVLGVIALLVVGCGDGAGGGGDGGGGDAARPDSGVPGRLTGLFNWRMYSALGTEDLVLTDSTTRVEVVSLEAGGGGFRETVGFDRDGRFVVMGVPAGEVMITSRQANELGNEFLYGMVTEARDVDMGADKFGRFAPEFTGVGTAARFDVTGLAPWSSAHTLRMLTPNFYFQSFEVASRNATGMPTPGATALAGLQVSWESGELDADLGDSLLLVQRETVTSGSVTATTIKKVFTATPTMVRGATTALSGAFSDPTTVALPLVVDRSKWDAEIYKMAPGARPGTMFVTAFGGPMNREVTDVADFALPVGLPMLTRTLTYADPFDGRRFVSARVGGFAVVAPGARTGYTIPDAALVSTWDLTALPAGGLLPNLTAPRELLINGTSAAVNRTGVGTQVTLSWTAPEIGTARHYGIVVHEVVASAGGGTDARNRVGEFDTGKTTLVIPDGVLVAGKTYVACLYADDWRNPDAPYRGLHPPRSGESFAATALFSP